EERHPPYARPPLSKGLWKGDAEEDIWLKTYERNASIHVGRRIVTLDAGKKRLTDDYGEVYSYEKLLLATGGRARRFSFDKHKEVVYFRSVDDYAKLRQLCQQHMRFAVVGGGFIGSEIAAALAMNGKQ